jgi:hypothetical protein
MAGYHPAFPVSVFFGVADWVVSRLLAYYFMTENVTILCEDQ